MTRYLERAENTARLINVHGNLLLDLPSKTTIFGWEPLLAITGFEALFYEHYRAANETNVVKFLLTDEHNPSSIFSAVKSARENMRTTRDAVPREAWEELNNLYLFAGEQIGIGVSRRVRYDFLKKIIQGSQHITGVLHGTMSHDTAYNFMRIGCYLERADMTTRIVDVRSANLLHIDKDNEKELTPFLNIQWMSVLKSLTAYQMYRQHVRLQVQGADVLNFLLRNNQFPRSFFYCLERMGYCLKGLPRYQLPYRRLKKVQRMVQDADVHALASAGAGLHAFIDDLQLGLANVHDGINSVYFSMKPFESMALPSA
jgi:uncharacterized alpha-E superfamily protein